MVEYSDPRDFGFRPETVMTALMPYEQFSSKTRRLILGIDRASRCSLMITAAYVLKR